MSETAAGPARAARARVLRATIRFLAACRAAHDAARGWLSRAWHRCVAWRWTPLVARCLLGAMGLVLLAGIGRSALAGASGGPAPAPVAAAPSIPGPPASSGDVARPEPPAPALATTGAAPPVASPALEVADAGASPAGASRRATPEDPVVLNQAAFEDLRRLPGVGPKRAQAILALRQRLGRFRQVEDLLKVKGIGRSTLKKLRPLIKLDPTASSTNGGAPSAAP